VNIYDWNNIKAVIPTLLTVVDTRGLTVDA